MTSGNTFGNGMDPDRPAPDPPRPAWPAPMPLGTGPGAAAPTPAVPSPVAPPQAAAPLVEQLYGQPVGQAPVTGYGQPAPYQPWMPMPPPPQPNHVLRWVVAALAIGVICVFSAVGGLVGYADYTGALDTRASWSPGATPTDQPPAQNAPGSEWTSWARRTVDDAVEDQAQALLAGDEAAYLAVVDPTNAQLVADHKRRFKVLRAMSPGVWTQALGGGLASSGSNRSWRGDIKISYCFGSSTCHAVQVVVNSAWEFKSDRLVMVDLKQSASERNGPRPWEVDELTVQTGDRVVIGAAKANAWRLPDAVKAADRAAGIADQLAKWDTPPSRYVIFLAGPADWKKWYGHEQPDWAAAWAVPVSNTVTEVMVRTEVVQQRGLETLLKHELTHVTTLAGKQDGVNRSSWWLIEGIADYATMLGKPVNQYDAIPPTRSFVRGRWNGDPAVDPPTPGSSLEEASARYGVAFLAVRRISDKYGQDKMLDFFGRIVHDDQNIDAASTAALGAPWASVKADCVAFIRSSVR